MGVNGLLSATGFSRFSLFQDVDPVPPLTHVRGFASYFGKPPPHSIEGGSSASLEHQPSFFYVNSCKRSFFLFHYVFSLSSLFPISYISLRILSCNYTIPRNHFYPHSRFLPIFFIFNALYLLVFVFLSRIEKKARAIEL